VVAFLRAVALAVVVGVALGVAGQTGSDLHPRRRAFVIPVLALAAVVAVGVALTEDGVRDALRGVGWRGA